MKLSILLPGAVLALILGGTLAGADTGSRFGLGMGPGGPFGGPPAFDKLDANNDGALSADELKAFGAARFAQFDTNNDGKLDAAELEAAEQAGKAMRREMRIKRMISHLDQDGDGAISLSELPTGRGEKLFEHADTNGDGSISAEEFKAAAEQMQGHGRGFRHGEEHRFADGPGKGGCAGGEHKEHDG